MKMEPVADCGKTEVDVAYLRKAESDIALLRSVLASVINVIEKAELNTAKINAIYALRSTRPNVPNINQKQENKTGQGK